MKKIQLEITIEQKESWRVSPTSSEKISSETTNVKIASLVFAENKENNLPPVYRRQIHFQSIFNWLNRFFKSFHPTRREEKNIKKQIEK